MSIEKTLPKCAIFSMRVYGDILCILSDPAEFRSWHHKKRWRVSCKFQFEKKNNKKVIAQKPLTIYMKWTVPILFHLPLVVHWRYVNPYYVKNKMLSVPILKVLQRRSELVNSSPSVKQLWPGWHAQLLGVSSGYKLFAYTRTCRDMVANGRIRAKIALIYAILFSVSLD